jgi:hypothetical protein
LTADTKEKNTGVIQINDIDAKIIKAPVQAICQKFE